ncbi:MAG: hypothetical protein LBO80_03885 [Treponema sp.]|jgi:hypothetical protein|nr:hypothetical protein [Treponema sp.]
MPRGIPLFLIPVILLCAVPAVFAQEEEPEIPGDEWSGMPSSLYSRGDKTFTISLGAIFPTLMYNDFNKVETKIKPGGTGFLAFNYFLNSYLFIGAEIGGMFSPTIGENMVYIVPMGVKVGYQFVIGRFEFPVSLMAGFAPQQYKNEDYGGFFLKPSVSVFWRFNTDWSFGLNTGWWWVPQWTGKGPDAYGNFMDLTVCARYHF